MASRLELSFIYTKKRIEKEKKNNTPEYSRKSRMWEVDVSERKREHINAHIAIRDDEATMLPR